MFLDGDDLYVVSSTGQLLRTGFAGGAPTGTATVADATTDWRGRAVFLASVLPNAAPTVAFTADCTGVSCSFDAGDTTDQDGVVESYEWTFGDGEEGGGPTPQKDYLESGTYDVTLTVTDDGGLTSSVTRQVTVVKPNQVPTAAFTAECDHLDCVFDGTGSADADGELAELSWDFGDGTTATGTTPQHSYAAPGTYTTTLTVTDDEGATATTSAARVVVAAPAASTVAHVGTTAAQGNSSTPNVVGPTGVAAGDRLVLVLSLNAAGRTVAAPAGITGWTLLGTTRSGTMETRTYTKLAAAGDSGRRVTLGLDAAAKYTLTLAAYTGARAGTVVHASFAEQVLRADHRTPTVDAPAGAWVVSYWADKSSATTAFTLPASVTARQALCATGTGRVCSVLADSAGAVPTGRYGGLVATADAASATATTWSVVLRTAEANQPPVATFTHGCDSLTCSFDATASTDADGVVSDWSWDFGDGGTGSGATASHEFTATGTRDVTLTVTDDEGARTAVVVAVTATRRNALPTASFTADCTFLACRFDASAATDPDGTIATYTWDLGDGRTATSDGPVLERTYAAGGAVTVSLTVTDDSGGTATATRDVTPVAAQPISHVGSTVNQGNVSTPNVAVPAGVTAGDQLVLLLSINDPARVVGSPSGVSGWTLADGVTSGTMRTLVWTRTAGPTDAGRTVRFAMDAAAKYTLTAAAYRGDLLAPTIAGAAETVLRSTHTTPALEAAEGDWVLSYWADKSSATTSFTLPEGVVPRQAACSANAGRTCSVLADSGGPVGAGPVGGLAATADAPSASATAWTLLLRQAGNPPPDQPDQPDQTDQPAAPRVAHQEER
nr:PKD domain-containing protein [Nocardioides sp. IC4_145]